MVVYVYGLYQSCTKYITYIYIFFFVFEFERRIFFVRLQSYLHNFWNEYHAKVSPRYIYIVFESSFIAAFKYSFLDIARDGDICVNLYVIFSGRFGVLSSI